MSRCSSPAPALSIVIPVLNDDLALQTNLVDLESRNDSGFPFEVIVANGNSAGQAETAAICEQHGALHLVSPPGRGAQMNTGARASRGTLLLFLHADCRLPPDAVARLTTLGGDACWGSFKHRIDGASPLLRVIEWGANTRAGRFGLPYGDQAIFCARSLFERVGGYREEPLLEDVLLARALGRLSRPVQIDSMVRTDPRRWEARGVLRTTWINWEIMIRFWCGERDFERLARRYRARR